MILALDPSIANCGHALLAGTPPRVRVVASGVWHPSHARGRVDRFEQLADFVAGLIRDHRPSVVVVETFDGGVRFFRDKRGRKHAARGKSERAYAEAVGVCRGAARAAGAVVVPVTVNEWKGTADKRTALMIAKAVLGRVPADDNEADAVCIGMFWLSNPKVGATLPPT